MDLSTIVININELLEYINKYAKERLSREGHKRVILNLCKSIIEIEEIKDEEIIEDIINIYEIFQNKREKDILEYISLNAIEEKLTKFTKEMANYCYGSLQIGFESYKLKTILYYENDNDNRNIVYMAGSFYTDQEYRTFLATIQKGTNRNVFMPEESRYKETYNLKTFKDGYISRVKKAINGNTQDGYHADFIYDNGRFFLLRAKDNPVDIIYNWIIKNTQAAVLPEWKTYLYNTLHQKGCISECKGYNYTGIELRGLILSEEVTTDMIREIRKEGLGIGEIRIPRKPVNLDPSMSFIDVMNKFIIPYITERKHLYNIGDKISPIIESPIIIKKGSKLKKTYLYPRQKVMAQGMLNGVKADRNSLILNGGMGETTNPPCS